MDVRDREVFEVRYIRAIRRIGGYGAITSLPEQIKESLKATTDLAAKTKMLEQIADKIR